MTVDDKYASRLSELPQHSSSFVLSKLGKSSLDMPRRFPMKVQTFRKLARQSWC